ncbi:MAG: STAS domain-containing protein [Rhodothermales bacterium]|nr:STAS domain-containing protein [Rhodothermales bacterium]
MSLLIEVTPPDVAVVRVGKALDFRNAADFKQSCQEHVKNGVHTFILDFTGTGILDSTGLGAIFSLYRQLTPLGGQVVFAAVSRPVQVVVQLTRTYKVFRQYPSVEAALDYTRSSASNGSAHEPTGGTAGGTERGNAA